MKDIDIELKILEVAKQEFMEKGYTNASMRSIAEKSGCTTGMLYSRFADKQNYIELNEKDLSDNDFSQEYCKGILAFLYRKLNLK